MIEDIKNIISDLSEPIEGKGTSPATKYSYNTNGNSKQLEGKKHDKLYSVSQTLLYIAK